MIQYNDRTKVFTLNTKHTTYQMKISEYGHLWHTYYGARITDEDASFAIPLRRRSFCNVGKACEPAANYSLQTLPQEFSSDGVGDYRTCSVEIVNPDGSYAFEGKYFGHKIYKGKYKLPGLPGLRAIEGENTETLEICLMDAVSDVCVTLYYAVFEEKDVITRAVSVTANANKEIHLRRIMSATLDFMRDDLEVIHFWGHHNAERCVQRKEIPYGALQFGSHYGATSHYENNSFIICAKDATEDYGDCYGMSFMYSGNFLFEAEKSTYNDTRAVLGIHPKQFDWALKDEETFYAPEVVLSFSDHGFADLSHHYHDVYRENLCPSKYMKQPRPVLVNNWEATHMNFDGEKIVDIGREAVKMGVDLLVLDDGWFGSRNDDKTALGDWFVNEEKLGGSLQDLVRRVNDLGLKFGLWFEPEMISEDSDLYRTHPEWAIAIPGRSAKLGRHQLVLDFSRQDVQDYIIKTVNMVLDSANITYVKWDFNRILTDVYSKELDAKYQGEVFHRFVLGLYRVMDHIMWTHPDILFEGCSGGGGRFDAAMLYYQPQIWTSDNTDAIDRLFIQHGTSFFYPVSSMGAHVSVSPNLSTKRPVSFHTRSVVAMSGTFGYELDTTKMSEEDKAFCKEQSDLYRKYQPLIFGGDYYRVSGPYDEYLTAWNFVSKDKKEALANAVLMAPSMHDMQLYLKVKGLEPDRLYKIEGEGAPQALISGKMLAKVGFPIAMSRVGEYTAYQFYLSAQA